MSGKGSSGLSDFQWCNEHGIKPGTFYNWVKRLRKKSCGDDKWKCSTCFALGYAVGSKSNDKTQK